MFRNLMFSFFLVLALNACKKTDPIAPITIGEYEKGVFVVNEGPFGSGSGTIDFFNRESDTYTKNIFEAINNRPLGNIVQSYATGQGFGFIVVNNANRVEVVNANNFKSIGVINGLRLPRYAVIKNNKAYVSQWGDATGAVAVVDLTNFEIIKNIAVGSGPEQIIDLGNNNIAVLNSGGFGVDSTISIISTVNDVVINTVVVGDNPAGAVITNGKLWVLLSGINDFSNPAASTAGGIVAINNQSLQIERKLLYPTNTNHPRRLVGYDTTLYFLSDYIGSIHSFNTNANALPTTSFIDGSFYSLGLDTNGDIWAGDPGSFIELGKVYRFNKFGNKLNDFNAGIIPAYFHFK